MGVLRLSHVDISAPDLDLAAAYYTQVMGLDISERTDDRIFFKCWDERDHHSLAVRYDPRVGIDRFAFKVEHEDDLDRLENAVQAYGYAVERISKGEEVGQGRASASPPRRATRWSWCTTSPRSADGFRW